MINRTSIDFTLGSKFIVDSYVEGYRLESDPHFKSSRRIVYKIQVKQEIIDAIINTGSQINLISASLVQKLRLETTPHLKLYPLMWIHKDIEMKIDHQCTFKFVITNKYINEVTYEVVSLNMSSSRVCTCGAKKPSTIVGPNNTCSKRIKGSSSSRTKVNNQLT